MTTALAVSGLRKQIGAGVPGCAARVEVLRGVDLDVGPGEIVAIVGPRSPDTTTLLLCAAGLLRPDSGSVHWFGTTNCRTGVAYVPAQPTFYRFLTVSDVVSSRAMLGRVGLTQASRTRVGELGDATLRQLALADALTARPRLLLADHPLTATSPAARQAVTEALSDLPRAMGAVVFTATDRATAEPLAARIFQLTAGRIRACS